MTYMKQILQEESVYFAEASFFRKTMESVKGLTPKDMLLLGQLAVRDPKAAELKKLVISADRLLKSNGGKTRNNNEKLTSYAIAMMRLFADGQYVMVTTGNYCLGTVAYTAAGSNLPLTIAIFLPAILASIIFVIINRLLRKDINEREREFNRSQAKKLLTELKKLEKKVPEKEGIKIRNQIDKMEYVLNEKYNK